MTAETAKAIDYNGLDKAEATLPSTWYFDPAHHARELEAFWYCDWLYVCPANDLDQPRSFRVFEIGDQSILIVRGTDGEIRAFHNTCRHRGSQLCTEAEGRLKANVITCPYHAWTYSLEGDLVRTTSLRLPDNFDAADHGLYPVSVETWRGLVFVNLSTETPPMEMAFHRDRTRIDAWPIEDLVVGHRYVRNMACNWKVFWENFNECLHCPNVHPSLVNLVPIFGRRIMTEKDDPAWAEHAESGAPEYASPAYKGGLREGAVTWSTDGQASPVAIDKLGENERRAGQTYLVSLPSMFIVGHVDYMRIVRLRPLGPEETELTAEWLFPTEAIGNPDVDMDNILDFAKTVMEEDAWACELNQKGLHCRSHEAGVLMPEEYVLRDFHAWVRNGLGEPALAPAVTS